MKKKKINSLSRSHLKQNVSKGSPNYALENLAWKKINYCYWSFSLCTHFWEKRSINRVYSSCIITGRGGDLAQRTENKAHVGKPVVFHPPFQCLLNWRCRDEMQCSGLRCNAEAIQSSGLLVCCQHQSSHWPADRTPYSWPVIKIDEKGVCLCLLIHS